jgi:large subunit ribosomal protein L4
MPTTKKPVIKKTVKTTVKKTVAVKPAVKTAAPKKATKASSVAVAKKDVKELPKETTLKQSVYDTKGHLAGTITLPKEIFDAKINNSLVSQAVRVYLANQRRGTVQTKSRGEVSISTRKIWRQKGTGRARHGAKSAPIFVGGGVAHGPETRDYSLRLNQKMKKAALFSAFTTKLNSGEIKIVKGYEKLEPKTKLMADAINSLAFTGKKLNVLLVTPRPTKDFTGVVKAARNIKGVSILAANLLNTYEVLKSKNIVMMEDSVGVLKEVFLTEK